MNCPHCGALAPANARFCQECGGALQVICPQCGQAAVAGTRFCANCGARLDAGEAAKAAAKPGQAQFFPPPPPPPMTDAGEAPQASAFPPPPPPQSLEPAANRTIVAPPPPPPSPVAAPGPARQAPPVPPVGPEPVAWQPPAPTPWAGVQPLPPTQYEYKGILPRFLAVLIDSALLVVIGMAYNMLLIQQAGSLDMTLYSILQFGYGAFTLLYYLLLEANGGTLGKRILGMRTIAAQDGGRPGIKRALVRGLMLIVDFLPVFYLAGILSIASSEKKQRLGDRVAGTCVVKA